MKHVSFGGSVFNPLQISLKFDALRLEALVNTLETGIHIPPQGCYIAVLFIKLGILFRKSFVELGILFRKSFVKLIVLAFKALVNSQETRFHIRIGLVNASIQPFDVVLSCYPPGYTNDER